MNYYKVIYMMKNNNKILFEDKIQIKYCFSKTKKLLNELKQIKIISIKKISIEKFNNFQFKEYHDKHI